MPGKKVVLSNDELCVTIESLKAFRQTIVSIIGIEETTKKQRDVLSDARLDVEELIEKLEKVRSQEG